MRGAARIAYGSATVATPAVLWRELVFRLRKSPDRQPIPPSSLIYEVVGHGFASLYYDLGRRIVGEMTDTLRAAGVDLSRIHRILDFGCGCGRLIRHLHEHFDAKLFGTDYNSRLVAWCDANLEFAGFATNELLPPLHYAASSFDLIYARSVYTHLSEESQALWFQEMLRVLDDGGVFLFTTHGDAFRDRLTAAERQQYDADEITIPAGVHEGSNAFGTFQTRRYTERHMPKELELLLHVPGRARWEQDVYVVRKKSV